MISKLLSKLDEIEAEMKRIGFWDEDAPDLMNDVKKGRIKVFIDAPSFELWLQRIFLVNARDMISGENIPETSQVGLMALRQYEFHSFVEKAQQLSSLLREFDSLIYDYHKARKREEEASGKKTGGKKGRKNTRRKKN